MVQDQEEAFYVAWNAHHVINPDDLLHLREETFLLFFSCVNPIAGFENVTKYQIAIKSSTWSQKIWPIKKKNISSNSHKSTSLVFCLLSKWVKQLKHILAASNIFQLFMTLKHSINWVQTITVWTSGNFAKETFSSVFARLCCEI